MFGLRALLRLPICILDLGALRGKRPPRFPIACNQFQIDLHAASLGASSAFLRRASCRPARAKSRSAESNFADNEGVIKLPEFADPSALGELRLLLEATPGYEEWYSSGSSPNFSFGTLDNKILGSLVRNPSELETLVEVALNGDPWLVGVQASALRDSGSPEERSEAALGFHCDADYVNFVKLFVPLQALSEDECTQFVLGSQRGPKHALYRVVDTSFSDRPIWRTRVELGDCYLMCTSGWHSASARAEPRLVLVALFSTDLFGMGSATAVPISEALH